MLLSGIAFIIWSLVLEMLLVANRLEFRVQRCCYKVIVYKLGSRNVGLGFSVCNVGFKILVFKMV